MKKLFLSTSALCALALTASAASAADMRMPVYKSAPVVCLTCNWTGFYVGFNLGESKDWTSTQETWGWNYLYPAGTLAHGPGGVTLPSVGGQYNTGSASTYRHASMGFIGGLQWGYNWQLGGLLVGLEGDWNWSNEKDTYATGGSPVHGFTNVGLNAPLVILSNQSWSSEEKIDWLTTWRARLGWAHDCYLWYITGGVAWAKVETNYILSSTPGVTGTNPFPAQPGLWGLPGGSATANFSTTKTGWVIGGGVETSIGALFGLGNNNWSMKLEYLYVDLGTVSNTIGTGVVPQNVLSAALAGPGVATGSTTFYSTNHIYEQIIRVGVNYRFGQAAAAMPVYKSAPVLCPTCNWTGFYVGFNLGESKDWTSTQETWLWNYLYPAGTFALNPGGFVLPTVGGQYNTGFASSYRHASMGFLGGLQWGYNWQLGGLLVGFEGDWNWSNEKDTYATGGSPVHRFTTNAGANLPEIIPSNQGWSSEEKIDWLTTWRARLGWAHDCYLWYVTGGVAWAKIETNYILSSTPGVSTPAAIGGSLWGLPGGSAAANFSTTKVGWVLGAGVETSIGALFGLGNNNWSMKLEYLYVDLGSVNNTIGTDLVAQQVLVNATPAAVPGVATGSTTFYSTNHIYEQIIRIGVNYRFSYGAVAPIVTKR
jgi:outer membrane immunogenic protein